MGKTHAALGAAIGAGVILAPSLLFGAGASTELVCLGAIAGAIGGILPDVDSKNSIANRTVKKYVAVLGTGALVVAALLIKGQTATVVEHTVAIVCAVAMALLLMVGSKCGHRGFTHSLAACAVFTVILLPIIGVQFGMAAGMGWLVHLAIDTLNTKGIQLAFPAKKRFCFGLCSANGIVNQVLMYVGAGVVCVLVIGNAFVYLG